MSKKLIQKPSIIVSSIGRTGTNFLSEVFREISDDCYSLHEPDVLTLGKSRGLKHIRQQLKEMGVVNFFRKLKGGWSLAQISDKRFLGKIDSAEALRETLKQRKKFVETSPDKFYIESSIGYYGLLDLLDKTFKDYKAIYIVRDPRSWVCSAFSWGQPYKRRLKLKMVRQWPEAGEINTNPYQKQWPEMDDLARICWAWRYLNEFALDLARKNSNIRIFKFEDIFTGETKNSQILELLDFATDLKTERINYNQNKALDLLGKKINYSRNSFPAYEQWDKKDKNTLKEICSPLMKRLDY